LEQGQVDRSQAAAAAKPLHDEFLVQRLSQLGWVVGRGVLVEYRFADGSIDRSGEAAAEFALMKVDVIFVGGDSEAWQPSERQSQYRSSPHL
jgi:hypothetical protein